MFRNQSFVGINGFISLRSTGVEHRNYSDGISMQMRSFWNWNAQAVLCPRPRPWNLLDFPLSTCNCNYQVELLSNLDVSVSLIIPGSLPPSPADSGVSDVDSSSSGNTSNDDTKARLQPTPGH